MGGWVYCVALRRDSGALVAVGLVVVVVRFVGDRGLCALYLVGELRVGRLCRCKSLGWES